MSFNAQRLLELLPSVHRLRDADRGGQLAAFLAVIAGQIAVLEENLEQLYDDQFIETCADWVVPYIGDLIGYRTLYGAAPSIANPRAEVAHTIAYRRRKGTAAMLEQLARDVTGWDARVVEFFKLVGWTQYMNHICPGRCYAPDLRQWELLERLNSPFDRVAHTVDVRNISAGRGLYNIPNIGVFLWRLTAYSLTNSPASKLDDFRYFFNPLGCNTPLFNDPQTISDAADAEFTHLATPLNVAMPISRRVLYEDLGDYYGRANSLCLTVDGSDLDVSQIEVCDLADAATGWAHTPTDKVALDPVLGRIAFPPSQTAPAEVKVSFRYGFSADLGGGEYDREASLNLQLTPASQIAAPQTVQGALTASLDGGVVEIADSGRYAEKLSVNLNANRLLEWRAADHCRPNIVLSGECLISGGAESEITLNGLLISGAALRVPVAVDNQLRRLVLRHCTLVPGLSLSSAGEPAQAGAPSLIVEAPNVIVEIDNCILGGLRVAAEAQVMISNSIVDANAADGVAYAAPVGNGTGPGGSLKITNSTIIGTVHTVAFSLVSNSILLAGAPAASSQPPVRSERRQIGCVRFSYIPLGSQVPRRYRCQPDLALAARAKALGLARPDDLPLAEAEAVEELVTPLFTSLRYSDPGYCQLSQNCATEIRQGADDEAEMGAFHDLFQPQRETDLRTRLAEYLRFGLEAGIFYVT